MVDQEKVKNIWLESFIEMNRDIFDYTVIKPEVDQWIEDNIILPDNTTVYPGPYKFHWTPYMRAIVRHLHPKDPVRFVTVMKGGQSGATTGLVVPGLLYIISEAPDGILFTAGDLNLAQKTIEERFDPVIRASGLEHLIRPNVIKKTNNRSGDTSKKKEFAGGTLTSAGTNSANTFRMFSARYIFSDDYDTAPRDLGKEGSPKMLMKTRQNSYGDKAKTFFVSTPTISQTSNIFEQYLLGTQNKWHWPCPACEEYMPLDWQIKLDDGTYAGMVWQLDDHKRLIPETVRYRCPHCGHLIEEKEKMDLNQRGKWMSTCAVPAERRHESYQLNSIFNPPGFDGWITLVEEWLAANPPGEKAVIKLLKTFNNLRLGLPFEETGEAPRVNDLMQNTRSYQPGIVPNQLCEADGNGRIVMLTLACDINGIMEPQNEDIRLDWEILAHSQSGATYSVDHGSIGTFKRTRDISKAERADEQSRVKWTLTHNVANSVWDPLAELIRAEYPTQSGTEMPIFISVIDTGHGEKLATEFIRKMQEEGLFIFGVKGRTEENFRKYKQDTPAVVRSKERPKELYILEVNQIKNDLAQMMKLRPGEDGSQPSGFMNFPDPRDGKYTMRSYFSHYEGERKVVISKDDEAVGYYWKKKNSQSQNHFWDVRVYNLAAPQIFLDQIKRSDPKYKHYSWEDLVMEF